MKIESSKPESQSQVSTQDATAAAQTPTDLLFSLLFQAGLMPQANKPDIQMQSDANHASSDNAEQTQASNSLSSDNSPFLQQINFMSASLNKSNLDDASLNNPNRDNRNLDNPGPAKQEMMDATSDMTSQAQIPLESQAPMPSPVKQPPQQKSQTSQSQSNLPQDQVKQTALQNQAINDTLSQMTDPMLAQTKPITDVDFSQAKKEMNLGVTENDEQTFELANQIESEDTNQFQKNNSFGKIQPKITSTYKSEEAVTKTKLDTNLVITKPPKSSETDNKKSLTELIPTSDADSTSSMGAMQQLSAQGASFHAELPNHQSEPQNKYTDALVQLGGFINSHTASMATDTVNNTISSNSNNISAPAQANPALSPNDLDMSKYELKVDIAPRSMDSIMNEIYNAKIKIYPPELGAVMAKLKVGKNSTELSITTENDRVKAIVEQNLPQLRENFQNANINLTHIEVQTSLTDANGQNSNNSRDSSTLLAQEQMHNMDTVGQTVTQKAVSKPSNSLVDTYA